MHPESLRPCCFRGIISRLHDSRDCGGFIRLLTPAEETGIVLMRVSRARYVGNNSASVVLRPNAPQLDYQPDRDKGHDLNIKMLALSTHVIELDDGALPLKAWIRFIFGRFEAGSSASDRALPAAAGKRNQLEV